MPKRVLVIDDDPGVRKAFQYALADEGYDLELADSGLAALAAAQANKPDLVFLDLRLPEMDGIEVLRGLQRLFSDLPVYVVTAYRQDYLEQLRRAREDGARFELADKPLSDEQIRQIVHSFLGQAHLVLFYAGEPGKAKALVKGLETALRRRGMESQIELVDVLGDFERANAAKVFATPMLIRTLPEPQRRVVGDLGDADIVLRRLGFGG